MFKLLLKRVFLHIWNICVFRSVWSGVTYLFQLSWWYESELHCKGMWLGSASGWKYAAYKDLLHCCYGSRVGLFFESHMGDWVVPRSEKVQKHLSIRLHSWPNFSAISTCTAPTKADCHRTFCSVWPFLSECSPASVFLDKQPGFIGSRYKKVVYRQFTSAEFTKQVERTADMEHLGIMGIVSETPWMFGSHIYRTFSLVFCSCYDYIYFWWSYIVSDTGPMIHANVGDKVKVVFKNMASWPFSIHAHGVKTDTPDVNHTKPGTGRF